MRYIVNEMEKLRHEELLPRRRLFLNFLHLNEIAVFAGGPNIGKTFLVQDIINGINSGLSFWGEPTSDVRAKCIFVDLDQSKDMAQDRMKDAPEGLYKGVIRVGVEYDNSDEDISVESLISLLKDIMGSDNGPWFIVIDNISNLLGKTSSEQVVIDLVKTLRQMLFNYDASVLLIAHTVKTPSSRKPIGLDNIRGSKVLSGLVDSAFCLCDSIVGDCVCYVKHLKSRRCPKYTDVAEVELVDTPMIHFRLNGWNEECIHIGKPGTRERKYSAEQIEEVLYLHKTGFSIREIGQRTHIPKSTVSRIINEYN